MPHLTSQKGAIAQILLILLLMGGVILGVYLSQKPTDLKPSADVITQTKEASMTLINKGSNSLSVGDSTNVEVRVRSDFEAVKQIIATLIYDRSALEFIKGDLVRDNPARVSASSNPAPFYCPRVYKFDDKKCKGSKKGLIDNKFTCGGLRKTVNVSEGTCKTEKEWEVFMLQSCRGVDGIDDTEDQCNLRAATPAPAVGVVITDPRNPNNYIQSWNKPVGGKWFPYDTSHPNTVVLDALTVPSGFIT